MKKWLWLMVLMLCMPWACAEGLPEDGLYSIGVSSNATMFKIVDCLLKAEDEKMIAVMTLSGSGYGYLYQGTAEEAEMADRETWTPYAEDGEGRHRFEIEIPGLDVDVPMAAWSIRYEKWYDRTLCFFSNTLRPYQSIPAEGVYQCMVHSDTIMDGMDCIVKSDSGRLLIEIEMGEGETMDVAGQTIAIEDGWARFEISSMDVSIPIAFEEESGWIRLDIADIAHFNVIPEDGIYKVDVRTDAALLRFVDCSLFIDNGIMTAKLTAKNNNFDYLYMGRAQDAPEDSGNWIPAEVNDNGAYTYEMQIASLDNTLPVATYSVRKKLWYDREIVLDSETLTAIE